MSNCPFKIIINTLLACLLMLAGGCAQRIVDPQTPFTLTLLPSPVPNDATDQKPASRPDGEVVLSWWQNSPNDKRSLLVSVLQKDQWTSPLPVTEMANVVDAQIVPVGNDALAALWMVSKPLKTEDGEVHELYAAHSDKSGQHWSTPLRINQEVHTSMKESPALAAMPDGTLLAAWIDQRHYKMLPPGKPGEEMKEEGFSSLMVASVSADNTLGKELLVDKDFCNCCAPAIVTDEQEGLLAYREHLAGNVRDPAIMRVSRDNYSPPSIVHDDHWVIEGCPARGPAIARLDNAVGMAWLTSVNDKTRIRAAFSSDNGHRFAEPIDLEIENAVGVSGIEMDSPHSALVAWTSAGKQGEMTKLARVYDDGRIEHRTVMHALANGAAYKWPGPRMTKANDAVIIAWNDEQAKKLGLVKVEVGQ